MCNDRKILVEDEVTKTVMNYPTFVIREGSYSLSGDEKMIADRLQAKDVLERWKEEVMKSVDETINDEMKKVDKFFNGQVSNLNEGMLKSDDHQTQKRLYWIMSDKSNVKGVRMALEKKGINTKTLDECHFLEKGWIICGIPGHRAYATFVGNAKNAQIIENFFGPLGTELKPVSPESDPQEEADKFDKYDLIIASYKGPFFGAGVWVLTRFLRFDKKYSNIIGTDRGIYDEAYRYEDWMKRYVGTDIPRKKWTKEK